MPSPETSPEFLDLQAAVAGRYSLDRELGRGGMGIVFLARDVALDRPVAIKLLPPAMAAQPALRERFLREARTAAQLSHPNIVPIFSVEEIGNLVFFAMAWIDGETLGERLQRRGPVPAAETTRILREVAWALGYAHGQGLVHRDLKPDNIMMESATGRAVLTDFGIAHRFEDERVTAENELVGTPAYMSPEQAGGESCDGRADIYALGIVGYELLSGSPPFDDDSVARVLVQQATVMPPALAREAVGAPRALVAAIMRCLEKAPGDRFPDAKAFADALATAVEVHREVPAAVRAYLKGNLEVTGGGCMYVLLAGWIGPGLLVTPVITGWLGVVPTFPVYLAYFVVTLGVIPVVGFFSRLRRFTRLGYDRQDLLAGIKDEMRRNREEAEVEYGSGAVWSDLQPLLRTAGIATAAGGGLMAIAFGVDPGIPIMGIGILMGLISMTRRRDRHDVLSKRRLRFWNSRFGAWVYRLAARGAPRGGGGPTRHATELAISVAVDELFRGLPKGLRTDLHELPETTRKLESRAQEARIRVEHLEAGVASAREEMARGAVGETREQLIRELSDTLEQERTVLSESVAALETLRLGLLRLRMGAGDVKRITLDLASAGDLVDRVQQQIEGYDEVDRVLRREE
jgi:serine/threonine-protein kinase